MNMNFLTARRYLCDSVSCQNVQGIVNGWKSLFVKQPLSLATQGFQNYVSFFFFQQITVCPIILFSNYVPKISIYAQIDVTVCDRHFLYVFIIVASILSTYSIY